MFSPPKARAESHGGAEPHTLAPSPGAGGGRMSPVSSPRQGALLWTYCTDAHTVVAPLQRLLLEKIHPAAAHTVLVGAPDKEAGNPEEKHRGPRAARHCGCHPCSGPGHSAKGEVWGAGKCSEIQPPGSKPWCHGWSCIFPEEGAPLPTVHKEARWG